MKRFIFVGLSRPRLILHEIRFCCNCDRGRALIRRSEETDFSVMSRTSCGEERTEPEGKALHRWIYVPTLTCGHELWVVTERTRSPKQIKTSRLNYTNITKRLNCTFKNRSCSSAAHQLMTNWWSADDQLSGVLHWPVDTQLPVV